MVRKPLLLIGPILGALAIASVWGQGAARQAPLSITPAIDDAPTKAGDYDWLARHRAVLETNKKQRVDLIFVGDSITHGWGGEPADPKWNGWKNELWETHFRRYNPVNMGFGWDRTEHVLWRFENGALDGIHPKVAVVMIGTNNLWRDSAEDIALGIEKIVGTLRKKLPSTRVLLLAIFPRDPEPGTENRKKINLVNGSIAKLASDDKVTFLNIGPRFLEPGGRISKEIMPDYLHLSPKGYEIWAKAMGPTLRRLIGK